MHTPKVVSAIFEPIAELFHHVKKHLHDASHDEDGDGSPLSRQASHKARTQFQHVLSSVKLEAAEDLVLSVRKHLDKKAGIRRNKHDRLTCKLQTPPFNGFYNLVYKISFSDGTVWALKIPRRGHREEWSEIAARALLSEAHTMRLLKEETTIPLPAVYDFNATLDNELKCPYIMMEWLSGEALISHWDRYAKNHELFKDEWTRVQLLIDLANAVVQLGRFQFDTCGAPSFDMTGKFSGIGPVITRDIGPETIHAMPELIDVGPFNLCSEYFS